MPFLEWTPEMSVGVDSIDKDHQHLVGILNRLGTALRENKDQQMLGDILNDLISYTSYHFKREEELFAQTAYPAAAAHIKEHYELTRRTNELQAEYRFGATQELAAKVLAFVTSWFMNHVIVSDKKFSEHFKSCGII